MQWYNFAKSVILILFFHITGVISQDVQYYPGASEFKRNNAIQNKNEYAIHKNAKSLQDTYSSRKLSTQNKESTEIISKRSADPIFHGHPKTREEIWHSNFLNQEKKKETDSLIKLIYNITLTYLDDCTSVILYDNQIKSEHSFLFRDLLRNFPLTFIHGYINDDYQLADPKLLNPVKNCLNFIVFITDVKKVAKVLGKQSKSKIVVVARSSQWAVQEFLSEPLSRYFVNLLVIGQSFQDDDTPYILYTHTLYVDGLGSSRPKVICSWSHGKFSRNVNLFPPKMTHGYAGHRFLLAAANQPPFIFKRIKTDADGGNPRVQWDGIEVRIMNLLAEKNNFSVEIFETNYLHLGSGDAVTRDLITGKADMGMAGIYVTVERLNNTDMSVSHSHDCAAFATLMSTALPRYRAILGPFHWQVWVALTFTYLIGIFPLAFSDKHTLRHLMNNMGEVENMFWYVFGTFTNCFTFVGKHSWSKTTKITTRLLIGWYWIFTIIITSCYTGSIIAFVTLPIYPETVDTITQLLSGFYRVGTLDHGGWERWFLNSSDPLTNKLLKNVELVPDVRSGIMNITKAFFWPYAFIGSQAELEYLVQSNFSKSESKRDLLHISNECFAPFGVSISFPKNSIYTAKLSEDIRRIIQSGLMDKIVDDVRWELQRSSSGKLLSVGSDSLSFSSLEERGLTLEDTQGMFLLLGAGFLCAAVALMSEWTGGFYKGCRRLKTRMTASRTNLHETNERCISTPSIEVADYPEIDIYTATNSIDSDEGSRIINITKDNFVIHYNKHEQDSDTLTTNSLNLDKEVEEIFKIAEKKDALEIDNTVRFEDVEDEKGDSKNPFSKTYSLSRK
ncbi:ionotropic receptor 21a [Aricia agestis]|uniref:ionotropic receptor 21a n=1 Tax=Aricia agestis TaxID=91739 RepID=UPI001C203109|nr:ionotropic receptor 21a [Aricia agestis]